MEISKQKRFLCNLNDKEKYIADVRKSKETLNHGLNLEKVRRMVTFNQQN